MISVDHTPCDIVVDACDYELVIETSATETVAESVEHELIVEVPGLPGPEGPPGPPGPPGQDGAVVGGAVIDDTSARTDRVWSSQHTVDQIDAATDELEPPVDLTIIFDNALA